jgi:MFS family permease
VVDRAWAATEWTLGRAARTARFWWVFLGFFSGLFAWYAVQVHQTKYLLELGFSAELAGYALGLVGLTGIVGQIVWGHVSDQVGREWAWTASGLGFAICYAALLALPAHRETWLVYVMVAAQGLLGYGLASVFGAIPMELFQGARYGSIFAALNLASNAGAGMGPWVAGLVYDRTGSYAPAFWIAIACSAVSVVAMWLAAPRKVRLVGGRVPRWNA